MRFLCLCLLLYCLLMSEAQNTTVDTNTTTLDPNATTPLVTDKPTPAATEPTTEQVTGVRIGLTPSPEYERTYPLFCTCDLTSSQCDINCCCDADCSESDRLIFTSCDETLNSVPADRVCLSSSSMFLQNSPYQVQNADGQFCVEKASDVERDFLVTPNLIQSDRVFASYLSDYGSYSYSSQPAEEPQLDSTAVNYKSGDYLRTLSTGDASVVGVLMVPGIDPSSGACIDRTPAKFLEDTSVKCRRDFPASLSTLCESKGFWSTASHSSAFSLISSPYPASLSSIAPASTIPASITSQATNQTRLDATGQVCLDIVTKISYTIIHKYGVIEEVLIDIGTSNFANTSTSIYPTYSVTYREVNATASLARSGNPGYIVGEPMLAGWLTGGNSYVTFNPDEDRTLSLLTSNSNGSCDQSGRTTVKFGEDIVSGCILMSAVPSVDCPVNAALSFVLGDSLNGSAHIASFGSTSRFSPGDWVPVLRDSPPTDGVCNGLTTTLQILYSRVGSLATPQLRIVGAKLKHEVQKLDSGSGVGMNAYQFHVVNIVTFIDVSERTSQVDTSTQSKYSLASPTGFFYPFIWATSSANMVAGLNNFYLLLLLLVSLLRYLY